jgi:hypothetical protein
MAARIAIIAMTTSNSMRVKPRRADCVVPERVAGTVERRAKDAIALLVMLSIIIYFIRRDRAITRNGDGRFLAPTAH